MPTIAGEQFHSRMQLNKPKMSSKELVEKMIEKGIDIAPYSKEDIEYYLLNSNNFFRVCSYRKNYQKYQKGKNKGRYIGLNFDQLKALAILDMKIRKQVLGMCIDVEHSLKLYILRDFEESSIDGYRIVQDYFNTPNGVKTATSIIQKRNSIYVSELTHKYIYPKETTELFTGSDVQEIEYNVDLPIWAMLELMTFGDLLNFYFFYYDLKTDPASRPPIPKNVLHKVKNIRNACAHNNCILNHLKDKSANIPPAIGEFARRIGLTSSSVSSRLKCSAICEIMCTFYCIDVLASVPVKQHDLNKLQEDIQHFYKKYGQLFMSNHLVKSSLDFLKVSVDKLVDMCYNEDVAKKAL